MTAFLTPEWFDRLCSESQALPQVEGATAVLGLTVTKAPEGDVRVHLDVEVGRLARCDLTPGAEAPLEVVCPHDLALSVLRGETTVPVEFMRGGLKVSGDMQVMHRMLPLTGGPEFAAMLSKLAGETEA